ncbi:MAG: hypothetical protein HYZ31_09805 [Gammaproteobacteria bacterium]|nr:hypothetical protein [Gammaproteobacteria bacterium]
MVEEEEPQAVAGGFTKAATDQHLAWRFTGSAARVELAVLSPNHLQSDISDSFAKIFSGGKVLLADVPCGSGAASLSVLATISELRAQSVLPRIPLEVVLVGGEISEYARNNFIAGINEIRNALSEQAITIIESVKDWDVCNSLSNTDLIRELTIRGNPCSARMLLLANFSDFLQKNKKWDKAQPQFDELFRHFRSNKSSAIWIEPQVNEALPEHGGLLARVISWLNPLRFARLFSQDEVNGPVLRDNSKVFNALDESRHFSVRLAVMRVDLDI